MPKMRPDAERFNEKVDKSGGPDACWPWTGYRLKFGHGQFYPSRRSGLKRHQLTHRWAYALVHGPIPEGKCVCHRCDNPPCCNPAHLFLGTKKDNSEDMVRKGRHKRALAKVTVEQVHAIRARATAGEHPVKIAEDVGLHRCTVANIVFRRSWANV